MEKKLKSEAEFPKIDLTDKKKGVNIDYFNELALLDFSIRSADKWKKLWAKEKIKKIIADRGNKVVLHYEERFPPEYVNYSLLSDEAKKKIERLNEIADEVNAAYNSGDFDREKFARLFVEAHGLLCGESSHSNIQWKKFLEEEFVTKYKSDGVKE